MRRVFKQGGAVFALLAILITPGVYADDPPSGTEPPQVRIGPPIGSASQVRIGPPTGAPSQVRIGPPGGVASEARIGPPTGVASGLGTPPGGDTEAPTLFELFWAWLQVRIGPPIG